MLIKSLWETSNELDPEPVRIKIIERKKGYLVEIETISGVKSYEYTMDLPSVISKAKEEFKKITGKEPVFK